MGYKHWHESRKYANMLRMDFRPSTNDKPLSGLATKPSSDVIYGVFDGEVMRGKDGESYPVLMNYAAKSKLLEGDELELQWPKKRKNDL